jgi:hypothetical protein
MNGDKSKDTEIEQLCQDCCQVIPTFKPGESKKSWQLRYLQMKRKQLSQAKEFRKQNTIKDWDGINLVILPRKIYTAYTSFRQDIMAHGAEKGFEEALVTVLLHKLDEFALLICAIEVKSLRKKSTHE